MFKWLKKNRKEYDTKFTKKEIEENNNNCRKYIKENFPGINMDLYTRYHFQHSRKGTDIIAEYKGGYLILQQVREIQDIIGQLVNKNINILKKENKNE